MSARATLAVMVFASLAAPPRSSEACGYDGPYVTVASADSNAALAKFAAGEVGLFSPTWNASYLMAAYRWLEGVPLTASEQAGFRELWTGSTGPYRNAAREWNALRGQVRGDTAPVPATHRSAGDYRYYLNCTDDAFDTARQTLTDRMRVYRTQPGHYLEWLRGQEAVFSNCGGGEHIPSELDARSPLLLRKDREYQIAAALFYAGKFREAREAFDAIANDRMSPWQGLGAYLAVRALVREASLSAAPNPGALVESERRLGVLLKNADLAGIHPAARNLLALVRYRHNPGEQAAGLANAVAQGTAGTRFVAMVRDLRQALLDEGYGHIDLPRGASPALDWLLAARSGGSEGYARARAGYQAHGGDAWLVLALSFADTKSEGLDALLAASRSVDASSRALVSVRFHEARLLAQRGDRSGARAVLATIPSTLPAAAQNAVHGLGMALADNYRSWSRHALRAENGGTALHTDARIDVRERFSLPMMLRVASLPGASESVRRELLMAGFVRSLGQGQVPMAKRFARSLAPLLPDLASDLTMFLKAKKGQALGIGALVVLRHEHRFGEPSYRAALDDYSQSCGTEVFCNAEDPSLTAVVGIPGVRSRVGAPVSLQGTRIDALGERIEAFVQRYPKHPDAPEALHRLVRATRRASLHGTSTSRTGDLSKASFRRLHKDYKETSWARETRYWYR